MNNGIYQCDCKGCDISQGIECKQGGLIELEGNWILNHYGDNEGFLGWLALQPRYHRMEISELQTNEVATLGKNIQKIEIGLRNYWAIKFKDDPIERVYIIYFFEGIFDKKPSKYHLHLHLIVRTEEIGKLLRKEKFGVIPNISFPDINAWMIHFLTRLTNDQTNGFKFWQRYRERRHEDIMNLMTYLRSILFER